MVNGELADQDISPNLDELGAKKGMQRVCKLSPSPLSA